MSFTPYAYGDIIYAIKEFKIKKGTVGEYIYKKLGWLFYYSCIAVVVTIYLLWQMMLGVFNWFIGVLIIVAIWTFRVILKKAMIEHITQASDEVLKTPEAQKKLDKAFDKINVNQSEETKGQEQ